MHPNILCFILIGVGLHNSIVIVSKTSLAMASVFVVAALFLPIASYHQNIFANDQSESLHFHNYAMSILEILPYNSILFINYDQQWTSIRYIQECEGVRDDITSINLSMMSYPWW